MHKYNRWKIIFSSVIIQLCLGAIYAWGVFLNPIMNEFGWLTTEVSLAFTIFLVSYAVATIVGGWWQDIAGPRIVATAGGVLLGTGYLLASFTTSLPWLYITYGFIGGFGVGIAYVCPIATCVKWFPDKRGLATGLAVAGFGAGAIVFAPIASKIIEIFSWRLAFSSLGIAFLILITLSAQLLQNPPAGWKPPVGNKKLTNSEPNKSIDIELDAMIKMPQFWLLWTMFSLGATSGLMVIGHLASYGTGVGLTEAAAAIVVGLLAFFNGTGRVAWGLISDKIGREKTLTYIMFILGSMVLIFTRITEFLPLIIVASIIGVSFGGILSVFPSITTEYFGSKNVGKNYGMMFTAYGVAGVIGPMLGAAVFDYTGTYYIASIVAGIGCLVSGVLSFLLKNPQKDPKQLLVQKRVIN
ncbi:OFA family oxalate/formate antiporter-like MFS transporter [Desulfitispora alkaliphila]|uniref:L-lactate MFS transporter n=1 Tax=Desulfitispora alkaliphila TaxID=622674 RepID=UPI003D26341B